MRRHGSDTAAAGKAKLLFKRQKELDRPLETQRPGSHARTDCYHCTDSNHRTSGYGGSNSHSSNTGATRRRNGVTTSSG